MEPLDRALIQRLVGLVELDLTHETIIPRLPEDIREPILALRAAIVAANERLEDLGYEVRFYAGAKVAEDAPPVKPSCPTCGGRGWLGAGTHSFECPACKDQE